MAYQADGQDRKAVELLNNILNKDDRPDLQVMLSWAVEQGLEAMVRLLLEQNYVEANSKDNYGRTPLSWAAQLGHEAVVGLLVERDDVEPDSEDNFASEVKG